MVLSRNDKRKRKEGDLVDLVDPLGEPPKRTKIHAQRKFAQGAVTPVSYSPVSTPVKEKEKAKSNVFTELITHKRPNTEDFLTFLCFRGTSILPPSLNFFSASSRKEKSQDVAKPTPPSALFSNTNGTCGKAVPLSKPEQQVPTSTAQKSTAIKEKAANGPKKQVTAPIPKTIKLKTTSTAIQALKRKYQEQRLAKQRLKKKFKPTSMKTRSCATTVEQLPEKPAAHKLVAPRKVLSNIESRRHGLRSTGLPESEKHSLPLRKLKKQTPIKLKKKSVAAKETKEDTSSVDSFLLRSSVTKKASTIKEAPNKLIQKKIFKPGKKVQVRRVTRSHTEAVPAAKAASPEPTNLTRRPTRKTKEAAAVYMEILGRKLVSPDLENEDNMSLDSFPELPNARKIAQTENEIKAKVKSLKATAATNAAIAADKEKEKKPASNASNNNSKIIKKKAVKAPSPIKNKRLVKVQRYCELNSDEESVSSKESNEEVKTRRSAPAALAKTKKGDSRNLRSSRSLASRKSLPKSNEISPTVSNELTKVTKNTEANNVTKNKDGSGTIKDSSNKETPKEKAVAAAPKRKRESNINDKEKEKDSVAKQKIDSNKNKNKASEAAVESEEESLEAALNKLKKRKESEKEESALEKKSAEPKSAKAATTSAATTSSAETAKPQPVEALKNQAVNEATTAKMSDDEESFRGFTKKAISKVLNSCQTHVKANSLLENLDSKTNILKSHEIFSSSVGMKDTKKADIKTSAAVLSCIKTMDQLVAGSATNATANAAVKQEPDYGEMKVSSASGASLNIFDMPRLLTSHHRRKERVNMSAEQIEKWLSESSLAKEEIKADAEGFPGYSLAGFRCEPPAEGRQERPAGSHISISPKIQHLVRPVNVTLSKLSDRLKKASTAMASHRMPTAFAAAGGQVTPVRPQPVVVAGKSAGKPAADAAAAAKERKEAPCPSPSAKAPKDPSVADDPGDSDAVSKSDANSVGDSSEKKSLSSPEKKVFFHQRKPFLPKVKERKPVSSTSAFSPENESSVYAFESEAEVPVSTPFRRKAKDATAKEHSVGANEKEKSKASSSEADKSETKGKSGEETVQVTEPLNSPEEAQKDEEKSPPLLERTTPKNFELPKNFAELTNIQVLPLDKLTTNWSNVNCSASIAVQVNLDDQKQQQQKDKPSTTAESNSESSNAQKSTEISTQTDTNTDNDDDDSGQMFYIPLQAVTRNASAQGGQQLIQGVAVKLGTEGPTGPNQRVLLKAKLVTKPPISVARCPPIGTVQPTARTPQIASTDQTDAPSTSTVAAADANFKFPAPEEKTVKSATISKQVHKAPSSEKMIKSPKSRERKMSSDGTKSGKKNQKAINAGLYAPVNKTTFPKSKEASEEARLVEAPTFRPSEKDFQDPLEYIDKIRPIAEKFGICKVVPPSNFKPECKVSDDMRFTAYNHYVHRMLHRWGPNVKEMMAIKKYLATQSITLTQPPWIGGMEVDLPHLYQTVQNLGGLKEVIEKKKWQKVADGMKIPRSAQDRVTKLDDIYCKYLLPYDTLSQDERDKLFKEVEADWAKREKRDRQEIQSNDNDDDEEEDATEEIEECIVKGRNMPLNAFYRIARNTQRMWFGENQGAPSEMEGASADDVETAFWKHVVEKKRHVCVHAASIDSSGRGFGFSVAKNSPFGRHPWNLKILTNNAGSVLRALGPQMGVTVPTLHVGMLFSACCWYRDPHGLPWIEYLHTGAKKIWYGIPDEQNSAFRKALTKMFPRYCKNKTIWLPSDTAMVPPEMLVSNDVPLCQTVQEPGQFIIVFPKAFTSSICTGYVVSESVYFAQPSWLETAEQVFQDLRNSCEPSIFSFERLLFSIINDSRSHIDVLKQILPTVIKVCDREIENRKKLKELGLTNFEKLPLPENDKKGKGKKVKEDEGDYECDTCRANLFVSLVNNPTDESIFCLIHAIQYIEKKKQVLKNCKLMYTYSENELNDLVHKLKDRIEAKSKKTNQMKQAK